MIITSGGDHVTALIFITCIVLGPVLAAGVFNLFVFLRGGNKGRVKTSNPA